MYALGVSVTDLFPSSSIILMETANGCVIYISVKWFVVNESNSFINSYSHYLFTNYKTVRKNRIEIKRQK